MLTRFTFRYTKHLDMDELTMTAMKNKSYNGKVETNDNFRFTLPPAVLFTVDHSLFFPQTRYFFHKNVSQKIKDIKILNVV